MTVTTAQIQTVLGRKPLVSEWPGDALVSLAERANRELAAWGHDNHEISLEHAISYFGDPQVLSCTFWCETCHVSQLVLLSRPDHE